jgi:hypothetical protein
MNTGGCILSIFLALSFFALMAWGLARMASIDPPPRMPTQAERDRAHTTTDSGTLTDPRIAQARYEVEATTEYLTEKANRTKEGNRG